MSYNYNIPNHINQPNPNVPNAQEQHQHETTYGQSYNDFLDQYSDLDAENAEETQPQQPTDNMYNHFTSNNAINNNNNNNNGIAELPANNHRQSSYIQQQLTRPPPPLAPSLPSRDGTDATTAFESNQNNVVIDAGPMPAITVTGVQRPSRNNTINVIPNSTTFNQPNSDLNENELFHDYSDNSFIAESADPINQRNLTSEPFISQNDPSSDSIFAYNNHTSQMDLLNHLSEETNGNTPINAYHNPSTNTNAYDNTHLSLPSSTFHQQAGFADPNLNSYELQQSFDPHGNNFSPFRDVESGEDNPIFLADQGDDYQINSYLKRNGTMVDPYKDNRDFQDIWVRRTGTLDNGHDYNAQHDFTNLANYDDGADGSNSLNDQEQFGGVGQNQHMDLGDSIDDVEKLEFPKDREATYKNEVEEEEEETGTELSSSFHNLNGKSTSENSSMGSRSGFSRKKRSDTAVRKFLLENGNFVFDCPLSETLISSYYKSVDNPANISNEFKFMRYQAATCEPDDYIYENYTLRQQKFMVPRQTELMIVVTMYNEDEILLGKTLKGVFDNIRHMLKKTHSSTWGPEAWKKIVVCIVSDGRSKIHPRTLALMSALGCYQDGFAKSEINEKKVTAHIYEHTTKVNIAKIDDNNGIQLACDQSTIPVQLLFCLKENNQKKINSHRWAINAFAEGLKPEIIVLLDAGTKPGKNSIYQLWKEFKDPQVGGACGEIRVDLGKNCKSLINPLVAAQNFEYKMSNILDKTTESNFGFITVLPGAFSAYRFEALKGKPLEKYFFGDNMQSIKLFASNMYLAEDRILCFEIITKKDANWVLRYCKSSFGSTDVPEKIPEFMLQRRRWMNGSFFASIYSFIHMFQIWTSGQSAMRKLALTLESAYLLCNTVISWFALSSFFLVFRILTLSISVSFYKIKVFNYLAVIFLWLYGLTLLTTFILSLGNKPKGTARFYLIVFVFFAILMVYVIFCSIYLTVHTIEDLIAEKSTITFKKLLLSAPFRDMLVSMGSTYLLYLFSSIIYLQPWHMITSFIQYLLLSPAYVNVLSIYAFCNVHDITWGTKGASKAASLGKIATNKDGSVQAEIPVSAKEIEKNYQEHTHLLASQPEKEQEQEVSFDEQKQSYYASVRSIILIVWIISNFAIAAVVLETGGIQQYDRLRQTNSNVASVTVSIIGKRANIYFSVILWMVAFLAAVRALGCTFYLLRRFFYSVLHRRRNV